MTDLFKVVIIDSEANSLFISKNYLSDNFFDIKIINKLFSFDWLLSEFETYKPDIIFFNVEFKDVDVIHSLDSSFLKNTHIIFIISNKKFEMESIQYKEDDFDINFLKTENLALSIQKAVRDILNKRYYEDKRKEDAQNIKLDSEMEYLAIPSLNKIDIIKKKNILYCTANGRYTTFHIDNGNKFTSCKNLGDYADMLGMVDFYRVHHSYIVNINHISKIIKKDGYVCQLVSGMNIPIAKRRLEDFNKFLKIK